MSTIIILIIICIVVSVIAIIIRHSSRKNKDYQSLSTEEDFILITEDDEPISLDKK
jgi:hypothetical protein